MMKKYLILFMTILICAGGVSVRAQDPEQILIPPCWYGEAYSVDCVYSVSGGGIDSVSSLLNGCYFDWNYLSEENILLAAAASAEPLPDPLQTEAYMSVTASPGTVLTLLSLRINGKEAAVGHTVSGNVTSFGTDTVTVCLLKNDAVIHQTEASGESYRISAVLPGEYVLRVSKNGHLPSEYSVTVNGADVVQDVTLRPIGDANADFLVNADDAFLMKRFFAGYEAVIDTETADTDRDGAVTRRDAMILERYLAGWERYSLPYCPENAPDA
ncbi:MAG: hypothetical protein IJF78_05260 [Clostridia bacterium]|nr:hypothetical protein [Clostridia bacterium]